MKEKNVIEFYCLCNKLKYVIRTGWKNWNVSKDRLESIAEHVYGVQMLAIAMHSEFEYDIDLKKVLKMLAIHELGETIIGDLTMFDISSGDKEIIEHKAVHNILKNLISGEELEELFLEFDNHVTKESIFAFCCDKLECDIQCKIYDQGGYVDLSNQPDNVSFYHPDVQKLLNAGESWSSMWIKFGQERYPYDKNFLSVSNYILNNKVENNNDYGQESD